MSAYRWLRGPAVSSYLSRVFTRLFCALVVRGSYWSQMSVYEDRRDALEEYEFRMGLERGRLAVTLDLLTDALVLVGQHGVYCQSARQAGMPAMDIQMISHSLTGAKELIASVMAEIQRKKSEAG